MSKPLPGLERRLHTLRERGDRGGFLRLVDDLAQDLPEHALAFCLPGLRPEDRALILGLGDELVVRPNFGQAGATLKVRSEAAAELLATIGPDLGPGLVRLVVVPGVGAAALPPMLRRIPAHTLRELRLDGNGVRCRQPKVERGPGNVIQLEIRGDNSLLQAVAGLPALRSLRLTENRVGKEGASILAEMPLERVDLRNNPLGDAGAIRLAATRTLTSLRLEGCGIGPAGVVALSHIPQVSALDLSGNTLGPEGVRALSRTEGLRCLRVRDCGLLPDQLSTLRDAIPELEC